MKPFLAVLDGDVVMVLAFPTQTHAIVAFRSGALHSVLISRLALAQGIADMPPDFFTGEKKAKRAAA